MVLIKGDGKKDKNINYKSVITPINNSNVDNSCN